MHNVIIHNWQKISSEIKAGLRNTLPINHSQQIVWRKLSDIQFAAYALEFVTSYDPYTVYIIPITISISQWTHFRGNLDDRNEILSREDHLVCNKSGQPVHGAVNEEYSVSRSRLCDPRGSHRSVRFLYKDRVNKIKCKNPKV